MLSGGIRHTPHARTPFQWDIERRTTIHKITLLYNEIYWSQNAMPRSCLMPTHMIYFDRKLNCICLTIYGTTVNVPMTTQHQQKYCGTVFCLFKKNSIHSCESDRMPCLPPSLSLAHSFGTATVAHVSNDEHKT